MRKGVFKNTSKGLFNVEYLTVLILFVIFSSYFAFRLSEQRPAYLQEVKKEIYRSESYRLSEVLINDPGHPLNWQELVGTVDEEDIKRIGLLDDSKNKTNLLLEEKIEALRGLCAEEGGYSTVQNLLGMSYDFSIIIIDSSGSFSTVECKPAETSYIIPSIKRLVAFDSENYGEVIVQVW